MPISYRVDRATGIIHSSATGIVTGKQLADHVTSLLRDPPTPPPLREMHDMRDIEQFDVEALDLQRIVDIADGHREVVRGLRVALVAPDDHTFGMARMMESMIENAGQFADLRARGTGPEFSVFRDLEDATAWICEAVDPND